MAGFFIGQPSLADIQNQIDVCEDRMHHMKAEKEVKEKELWLTQQAYQSYLLGKDHELLDETVAAIELHKCVIARLSRQIVEMEIKIVDLQILAQTLAKTLPETPQKQAEHDAVQPAQRIPHVHTRYGDIW